MSAEIVPIGERYYNVTQEGSKHPEWMSIRDRATGKTFTVLAPSGPDVRFFLQALNIADASLERAE